MELSDLGRVYFNYFKNSSNGSVFFVLVKRMPSAINQNLVKTSLIEKITDKNKLNMTKDKSAGQSNNDRNINNFHKNNEDTNFLLEFLKVFSSQNYFEKISIFKFSPSLNMI